jgi:hypothetical protein
VTRAASLSPGLAWAGLLGLAALAYRRWHSAWEQVDLGLLLGVSALLMLAAYSLAGWSWRAYRPSLAPWRVLGLLASLATFAWAAEISAVQAFAMQAMPCYALATLLFALAALDGAAPPSPGSRAPWPRLAGLLAVAGSLGWALPGMATWFKRYFETPDDRFSVTLLFSRRVGGGAMDIPGTPFEPGTLLWLAPVLLGLGALLLAWRRWPAFRPWAPWAAAAWGWLSKLALAGLATHGLGILGIKITSINTAYYTLVDRADAMGWGPFIMGFSKLQGSLGPHGETHSFLPILVYKALRTITLDSPLAVAIILGAVNALIAVPVWRLAQRHFGHPAAGLAAALLLLSSPLSLILSAAGIDAMVALFVALTLERLDAALRGGGAWACAQAGLAAFVGSLLSYGFPLVNLFFFPWAWWVLARSRGGWLAGALPAGGRLALYSAVFLGLHGLLYAATGGGFNVLQGLESAGNIHHNINAYRLYSIWSWGNVILYAGYLGVGILAAWVWRLGEALWRGEQDDAWLLLTLPLAATLIFAAMGRGEVQRMFLYAFVFIAPAAAGAFLFARQGRLSLHLPSLWLLACANVANAALLQAAVLDYW